MLVLTGNLTVSVWSKVEGVYFKIRQIKGGVSQNYTIQIGSGKLNPTYNGKDTPRYSSNIYLERYSYRNLIFGAIKFLKLKQKSINQYTTK